MIRILRRNRSFAALNVTGLALAMACVTLIALYVHDELAFDRFHANRDCIVRVSADLVTNGDVDPNVTSQGLLAPALEADVPGVEYAVRLEQETPTVRVGADRSKHDVTYADPAFFSVFTFPLLHGDAASALDAPGRIVLTEALARALFGRTDAVGESIEVDGRAMTVSGIAADPPRTSTIHFEAVASLSSLPDPGWFYQNWYSLNFLTYVLLRPGTSPEAFGAALPAFIARQTAGDDNTTKVVLRAEPMADLYLGSDRTPPQNRGSFSALLVLSVVAAFVLLLAGVNFTTLATARSLDRAREVGVRKTLGASRASLGIRFLGEAVLLSTVAFGLGLGIALLATPAFEALTGKPIGVASLGSWLVALAGLAVVVGLVAGAYPAVVLSAFRPTDVLKGRFAVGRRGAAVRRGLVAAQFAISIGLVAATAVVVRQVDFMQRQPLGIELGGSGTQLVVLPFADSVAPEHLADVKRQLLAVPGVVGAASSITSPTGGHPEAGGDIEAPGGGRRPANVEFYLADADFLPVYGMRLVAGEAPQMLADSTVRYVLNETAVRQAGYASPEAALGASAQFWGFEGEVAGVVRDFHTSGLQTAVPALALAVTNQYQQVFTVRIRSASVAETLAGLEGVWTAAAPEKPFDITFLDAAFGAQYDAERRFGTLFALLAALAVVIATLGLFGLAAHAAQQRTKEIGVRRVLGATVAQVVVLLTRGTVGLVAFGAAVAIPVVVVGMRRWLAAFAYQTGVGWVPFVVAVAVVASVALATVAGQSVRAAVADPVRSLRSE